jgi:hypothetical protein
MTMSGWPPETVETPLGTQPFKQAACWHMPTQLRWLDHNRDANYMPGGDMVGSVLRACADRLESLAARREPQRRSPMIPYITPEQVDEVLAKPGLYVALPILNADDAAELFNRMLDHLQGEQHD